MKRIEIVDRSCCGQSAATATYEALARRLDGRHEVVFRDLNSPGAAQPVPPALGARMESDGDTALPALVIDGELVAAGGLPNLMDVLDVVEGRVAPRPTIRVSSGGRCCD